jgi:hypothetical protein
LAHDCIFAKPECNLLIKVIKIMKINLYAAAVRKVTVFFFLTEEAVTSKTHKDAIDRIHSVSFWLTHGKIEYYRRPFPMLWFNLRKVSYFTTFDEAFKEMLKYKIPGPFQWPGLTLKIIIYFQKGRRAIIRRL